MIHIKKKKDHIYSCATQYLQLKFEEDDEADL